MYMPWAGDVNLNETGSQRNEAFFKGSPSMIWRVSTQKKKEYSGFSSFELLIALYTSACCVRLKGGFRL